MAPTRGRRARGGGGGRRSQLVLGFLIGMALTMVISSVGAAGILQAEASVMGDHGVEQASSSEVIVIGLGDAGYMNRLYSEVGHELGFCGQLTDDQPNRLEVWLANTLESGPDHVEFITTNCPPEMNEVLLHTHPSGTASLSEEDVEVLTAGPESMLCVQAGTLPVEAGRVAENLACYREAPPDEPVSRLQRVRVRTADTGPPSP